MSDIAELRRRANTRENGYLLTEADVFALGYMAGRYDLAELVADGPAQQAVVDACAAYDVNDPLGLNNTIAETLADLGAIPPIN